MPILDITLTTPFLIALPIAIDGLVVVDARDDPLPDHVVERLEGDVRVDRAGAIAQEQGEVMNFAGIAAFDDQPGARAQPPADHLVVQARARQERRDRRHARPRRPGRRGRSGSPLARSPCRPVR